MESAEIFQIVAGVASIVSLLVTLLLKRDVKNLRNQISNSRMDGQQAIKGSGNVQVGGGINV